MIKDITYTIIAICICLGVGKVLNYAIGGLPASLYGMIFYCLFLQLGWFVPSKVHQTNQWVIKHMGVCFIPAAVGVINHFELFKDHGFALIAIIIFTTFLLITLVGFLAEKHLTKKLSSTDTKSSI